MFAMVILTLNSANINSNMDKFNKYIQIYMQKGWKNSILLLISGFNARKLGHIEIIILAFKLQQLIVVTTFGNRAVS